MVRFLKVSWVGKPLKLHFQNYFFFTCYRLPHIVYIPAHLIFSDDKLTRWRVDGEFIKDYTDCPVVLGVLNSFRLTEMI